MNVNVQLFSILRDCLPSDKSWTAVTLPDGATLADLMVHLGIDQRLGYNPQDIITKAEWLVLINKSGENDTGRTLQEGDKVQIFPSVAGG